MANKFCANCGGGLGPADRFCPLCGTKVISACPTCGQAWDGTTVVSSPEKDIETQPRQQMPSINKTKKTEKVVDEVVEVTSSTTGNMPIYGSLYDPSKDCANCGKAGKKKGCDSCGSGSSK
jgi:predicted amidophosphoribosyltransferase